MAHYQQLARQLQEQIEAGIWQVGDKLPALRETAERSGLSLMTVLHAYRFLESQGWASARPQSGYYVTPRVDPQHVAPSENKLHLAEQVDINAFIFDVLQASSSADIVAFGSAFPDPELFPQRHLARSLASVARRMTPASTIINLPPGSESLRRSIAQRYAQQGIQVSPDEIVITSGALESLNLSLQALTEPGDWVVVESPAFYGALQAIERHKLKVVAIASDPQQGIDLDALEQALIQYPVKACWLMTQLQHPLGCTLSEEKKQRLVTLLEQYQVGLIEDDVYGELYAGNERPLPAKALERGGVLLHCSSFSKCLVAGFRVGWVAAGQYAPRIQRLQLMSTLSTSAPMQLAIADYLASSRYDNHLRRLRRTLEQRKNACYQALKRHFPANCRINCAPGGYFVWIELTPGVCTTQLYWLALEQGISIAPGRMFCADERYNHCFRLNTSYACDARSEEAIRILARLIVQLSAPHQERGCA